LTADTSTSLCTRPTLKLGNHREQTLLFELTTTNFGTLTTIAVNMRSFVILQFTTMYIVR